jgi:hypothetical protein
MTKNANSSSSFRCPWQQVRAGVFQPSVFLFFFFFSGCGVHLSLVNHSNVE